MTRSFVEGFGAIPERPVELWDTATGRLVARLDAPDRDVQSFQFLNGGRWITTLEKANNRFSNFLVLSAEDGRLLGRLEHPLTHPDAESLWPVRADVSPTGRTIATVSDISVTPDGLIQNSDERALIRVWDVKTWQARSLTTIPGSWASFFGASFVKPPVRIRYWMDDAFGGGESVFAFGHEGRWTVYRAGQNEPIAEFSGASDWPDRFARVGDLAHGGEGHVYDTRTWQRLLPPPGRKFHPDLARFAPDGRFVRAVINGEQVVIDTRTGKSFPVERGWEYLPGAGMIATTTSDDASTIGLLPSAAQLDVPADLLELWVQVAVRGELGPEGEFVKWDEPTWERKRQQLSAGPAPNPALPFPGRVATDKLHWLRAEFGQAKTDADKLRIARELLRGAEAADDHAEAVRWRAAKDRLAPQPDPAAASREP